jgi:hypothetical protein
VIEVGQLLPEVDDQGGTALARLERVVGVVLLDALLGGEVRTAVLAPVRVERRLLGVVAAGLVGGWGAVGQTTAVLEVGRAIRPEDVTDRAGTAAPPAPDLSGLGAARSPRRGGHAPVRSVAASVSR